MKYRIAAGGIGAIGFTKADVVVLGPNDRKGNMVARYRGLRFPWPI